MNVHSYLAFYLSSSFLSELAILNEKEFSAQLSPVLSSIIFLVGFFSRPVGAILFGLRADSLGYTKSIRESLTLLMASTALVGLLPISKFGFILLALLRILQGLALGGVYPAMAVYLFRNSPANRQGRITSFLQMSVSVGYLMVLLLILVVKTTVAGEFLQGYGWRVLFFLPLIWLFLFRSVLFIETDEKDHGVHSATGQYKLDTLLQLFRANRIKELSPYLTLAVGLGVLAFVSANFKFYFLKVFLQVPPLTSDISASFATVLCLPFYYLGGFLVDRFNAYKVTVLTVLFASVVAYPCYRYIELAEVPSRLSSHDTFLNLKVTAALALFGAIIAIPYGGMIKLLCQVLPRTAQAITFGLIYSIAVGLSGGLIQLWSAERFFASGDKYFGVIVTIIGAWVAVFLSLLLAKQNAAK